MQQEKRRTAVQAVLDGASHQAAADVVGVKRQTVTVWMARYREGGWDALKIHRGRPKGSALKPHQAAGICRTIRDKCPDQLKLFGCLWTAAAVSALIARRFGIQYSERHVQRLLKRWGYTPQKPIRRAYEQNPEAVEAWLKTEYPAISRKPGGKNALIYWEDETGVRSDYQAGSNHRPAGPDSGHPRHWGAIRLQRDRH